jgi:hypothetical protein
VGEDSGKIAIFPTHGEKRLVRCELLVLANPIRRRRCGAVQQQHIPCSGGRDGFPLEALRLQHAFGEVPSFASTRVVGSSSSCAPRLHVPVVENLRELVDVIHGVAS